MFLQQWGRATGSVRNSVRPLHTGWNSVPPGRHQPSTVVARAVRQLTVRLNHPTRFERRSLKITFSCAIFVPLGLLNASQKLETRRELPAPTLGWRQYMRGFHGTLENGSRSEVLLPWRIPPVFILRLCQVLDSLETCRASL